VYHEKVAEADGARLKAAVREGWPLYVFDQNQVAWRILADLEDNAALATIYHERLQQAAAAVSERILAYRDFQADEHRRLKEASAWDWRPACDPPGQPQRDLEAVAAYGRRLRARAPLIAYERDYVQHPLEAAHVMLLSGDQASLSVLREHMAGLLTAYPHAELMLSWSVYNTEADFWRACQCDVLGD
jgi:hypothetical protein